MAGKVGSALIGGERLCSFGRIGLVGGFGGGAGGGGGGLVFLWDGRGEGWEVAT